MDNGQNSGRENMQFVTIVCDQQVFTGVPIGIQTISQRSFLALYQPEGGINRLEAVSLVPLASITSLTLMNLRQQMAAITEMGPWSLNIDNAPSRLNVERSINEVNGILKTIGAKAQASLNWEKESDRPEVRVYMQNLVGALTIATQAISDDSIGRQALQSLEVIILSFSESVDLEVSRQGDKMMVAVGFKANLSELKTTLQKKIEEKI